MTNGHNKIVQPGKVAGQILRERGKTAGWLAAQIGTSANSISSVLKDKSPKTGLWPAIAAALKVPVSVLFQEDIA